MTPEIKKATYEMYFINTVNEMCIESLPPDLFEAWGKIQEQIIKNRGLTYHYVAMLDSDFTLWVVVNKWQYDYETHQWYNDYITELKGRMLVHSELYNLFKSSK